MTTGGNPYRGQGYGEALIAALLAALAAMLLPAGAASASSLTITETFETIEYEIVDPLATAHPEPVGETFGPFSVVTPELAEMRGTVDSYSPQHFAQMLRRYPNIAMIRMVDCDGSVDEEANLELARMIRRAGISTHVPAHGSIRSGAVELFLAGARHTADPGAEFLVHSWMDEDGYQANDYPPHDPVHREYLDYYTEMGLPADTARAFYALTNSVPFESQLRLSFADLRRFQILH